MGSLDSAPDILLYTLGAPPVIYFTRTEVKPPPDKRYRVRIDSVAPAAPVVLNFPTSSTITVTVN